MKKLDTTTSPLERLKLKSLTMVSVDQRVDQLELPDIAGGRAESYRLVGQQIGSPL